MMRRIGIHFYNNSKPLKKYLSTSTLCLNEKNNYNPTTKDSRHFEKFNNNSNKKEFVRRHETNRQYTPRSQLSPRMSQEQLTPSFFMEKKKVKNYSRKPPKVVTKSEHEIPAIFYEGYNREPRVKMELEDQLTPEFIEKLVQDDKMKYYRLEHIRMELSYIHSKGFPVPKTLSIEDWSQLLKYENTKVIVMYLDAILDEKNIQTDEEFLKELDKIDSETYAPLTVVDQEHLESLFESNPENREIWNTTCLLHEKYQMNGEVMRTTLNPKDVEEIFRERNKAKIGKLLLLYAINDRNKLRDYIRSLSKKHKLPKIREAHQNKMAASNGLQYGLGGNTLIQRLYPRDIDMANFHRVYNAENSIVVDLGFFHRMNGRETKSLINQELPAVIRHNRECPQPLKLHFTNYHPKIDKFKPIFKEMLDNSALNPETLTSKSYLDLFPRNRLVYLSPDSREVLWNYNPDDVYIIGGLVDLDYKSKESLAIAKQQGIRHARLPMGETLGFNQILNVDTVMGIMLDFQRTQDWFYSLRWVPSRHFKNLLKGGTFTHKQEYIYLTHRKLSPTRKDQSGYETKMGMLNPQQYRKMYSDLVSLAPDVDELLCSSKYVQSSTIRKEKIQQRHRLDDEDMNIWNN